MEIYFKNIHPGVTQRMLDRAEKKIERAGKIIDEGRFEAQAFMEIGRISGSQTGDKVWRASINMDARGERFHAESVQDSPGKAADRAVGELQSELRTYQAREKTLRRKGGSIWKSFQRGFSIQ